MIASLAAHRTSPRSEFIFSGFSKYVISTEQSRQYNRLIISFKSFGLESKFKTDTYEL